jgi:hypothetical protein
MAFAAHAGAALLRSGLSFGGRADSPSIDPWALAFADAGAGEPRRFPELDCLRSTMAPGMLAAAEDRAAALAVGADRATSMSENIKLHGALLRAIAERGGVVTVNGRKMIKTEVERSVLHDFVARLFAETHDRLARVVPADPEDQNKLAAVLEESERHIEKLIADGLPVRN